MPLLKAMHHGKYRTVSEVDEETHRKQSKEKGETRTRLKGITTRQEVDLGMEFMTHLYVVSAATIWMRYRMQKQEKASKLSHFSIDEERFKGSMITNLEYKETFPDM